jgi:hypothetical protein
VEKRQSRAVVPGHEAKQVEKARSKLAKIRRQTAGLTRDEFRDKAPSLFSSFFFPFLSFSVLTDRLSDRR